MSVGTPLITEGNYGNAIISIFREGLDKLLSRKNTPVPKGSSFYDGVVEDIWDDPLKAQNS